MINQIVSNGQLIIPNTHLQNKNQMSVSSGNLKDLSNSNPIINYESNSNIQSINDNSTIKISSPVSSSKTMVNVETPKPSPKFRLRNSFKKPKILEWCSNQLSFGKF